MPGPGIGSTCEEYAEGGRGVEIEIIEICRGGSLFGGATGSFSTSSADGETDAGSGACSCSGCVSAAAVLS